MKKKNFLRNSFILGIILGVFLLIIMESLNLFLLGLICSALIFSLTVVMGTCLEYK